MDNTSNKLDNRYQAPEAELVDSNKTEAQFFVVSTKKLFIMNVVTLGLYPVFWFYKHYSLIRAHTGQSMWPVMRGIFYVFFAFNLFKRIHQAAQSKGLSIAWSYQLSALAFIFLYVFINTADNFSQTIGAISLLALPLAAYITVRIQATVNEIENDIEAKANNRFTIANIVWMIIGLLFWAVLILDLLLYFGWISFNF